MELLNMYDIKMIVMPYIKIKALYNFDGKLGDSQSVRKAKGKIRFKVKYDLNWPHLNK